MAAEIILDTVEDSSAEQFGVVKRHARGGLAVGLDTSVDKSDLMWSILNLSGMPKSGDAHPTKPELKFHRVLMRGASGDAVRFQLVYETFNPYGPASAYYIGDDSYLGTYTTNLIPGTRKPIRCSFTDATSGLNMPEDFCPITIYRPLRAVNVTALVYGNPDGDPNGIHVGEVNNATWRGLGIGYWLMARYYTNYSKFQGYYQKEMQAISRVTEDWSETAILRNQQTGRFPKIPAGVIESNLAIPYAYGLIGATAGAGFVRVGPFQTGYFNLLFGFN